jgi:hypothetical protein
LPLDGKEPAPADDDWPPPPANASAAVISKINSTAVILFIKNPQKIISRYAMHSSHATHGLKAKYVSIA